MNTPSTSDSAIADFLTERLSVRSWASQLRNMEQRAALETNLGALLTPEVLQTLPPALHLSQGGSAISDWIKDRDAEGSVLTVETRADTAFLGLLILAQSVDDERQTRLHIGYFFAPSAWGNGYATELIKGLVAAAPNSGVTQMLGGVAHDNPASARVLEKAGFVIAETDPDADTHMFVWTAE